MEALLYQWKALRLNGRRYVMNERRYTIRWGASPMNLELCSRITLTAVCWLCSVVCEPRVRWCSSCRSAMMQAPPTPFLSLPPLLVSDLRNWGGGPGFPATISEGRRGSVWCRSCGRIAARSLVVAGRLPHREVCNLRNDCLARRALKVAGELLRGSESCGVTAPPGGV